MMVHSFVSGFLDLSGSLIGVGYLVTPLVHSSFRGELDWSGSLPYDDFLVGLGSLSVAVLVLPVGSLGSNDFSVRLVHCFTMDYFHQMVH